MTYDEIRRIGPARHHDRLRPLPSDEDALREAMIDDLVDSIPVDFEVLDEGNGIAVELTLGDDDDTPQAGRARSRHLRLIED